MNRILCAGAALASACLTLLAYEPVADACGCLSPPVPVDDDSYAVNQQSEQIIFEVEPDHIVAHVLIRYAGSPESFAWIVLVPDVPELSLSSTEAFGLPDQVTSPRAVASVRDVCPESRYYCVEHPPDFCDDIDDSVPSWADAGTAGALDGGISGSPPVVVIDRQTIGSYDPVIFSAGNTADAVQWLNQEGFIINQTMAPFMQPYADAGMVFVASRLVPGADVSEIRPLRMRFPGTQPMIPLRLTAVATEPNVTVTAYIYGQSYYRPDGHPLVALDSDWLSRDPAGRSNYPMVLARAIDAAGGDGFVAEYMGDPAIPDFDNGTGCCSSDWDFCGIEGDGQCSCPNSPFDAAKCAAEYPELGA